MLCETNWFATHRERPTDLADWWSPIAKCRLDRLVRPIIFVGAADLAVESPLAPPLPEKRTNRWFIAIDSVVLVET
jgi:hypothetical protein